MSQNVSGSHRAQWLQYQGEAFVCPNGVRVFTFEENKMRSELVFGAAANVSNRYLLMSVASRATRMLHRPDVRLEDTSNEVFRAFGRASPIAVVNRSLGQFAVRATDSAVRNSALFAERPQRFKSTHQSKSEKCTDDLQIAPNKGIKNEQEAD